MARFYYAAIDVLLLLSTCSAAVVDLTPRTFYKTILKPGQPALVSIHYNDSRIYGSEVFRHVGMVFDKYPDEVLIARLDPQNHSYVTDRFPYAANSSILWFDGKSEEPELYPTDYYGYNMTHMVQWVRDRTGLEGEDRYTHGVPEMLTGQSFHDLIGGDRNVLVLFRACWDAWSWPLLPIWENLAHGFDRDSEVVIAILEMEREGYVEPAREIYIYGFPTVSLFKKGSREPEDIRARREVTITRAIIEKLQVRWQHDEL